MSSSSMFIVGQDQFEKCGSYICKQILTGGKISLFCGAGISTAAGIPDFRSSNGLYSKKFHQNGLVLQGRDLFDVSTLQNAEKLALFNQIMTDMRIKSRTAPITTFHHFVATLSKEGRLQRCYTQNFDGLQTKENPELEPYIYELHGTNTQLICHTCGQQPSSSVSSYDMELLQSGLVQCPHCQRAAAEANQLNKRRRPIGYLAPNVLLNQQPTTLSKDGIDLDESLEIDTNVDLLLIVGTSLATPGAYKLAKEMVHGVHEHGGVVVYVDRRKAGRKLAALFDMQLQLDIEEWSRQAVIATQEMFEEHDACGVKTSIQARMSHVIQMLHQVSNLPASADCPQRMPSELATFSLQSSAQLRSPPMSAQHHQRTKADCARVATNLKTVPATATIFLLVVHTPQVAMEAQKFLEDISQRLRTQGFNYVPELVETGSSYRCTSNIEYQESAHVWVIYVSSSLSSHFTFDENKMNVELEEMLLQTKHIAGQIRCRRLLPRAIFLCNQDAFLLSRNPQAFSRSLKRGSFIEVLGCLNLQPFEATSWAAFLSTIVVARLTKEGHDIQALGRLWLDVESLYISSNLMWFPGSTPAVLLLSSPWSARPLGRPLPDINHTCGCSLQSGSSLPRRWKVFHFAQDGMQVQLVSVFVECSKCKRSWKLCTDGAFGKVHQIGPRFMVERAVLL